MDSATVEKCLNFCDGLVKSNRQFSFSLSFGKDISFNFQNKEPVKSSCYRKKKSPSQVRREAKRKNDREQPKTTERVTENISVHESTKVSDMPTVCSEI